MFLFFSLVYFSLVGSVTSTMVKLNGVSQPFSTEYKMVHGLSQAVFTTRGGGELPYEEYMGVCHELGSHFQEKIPKRVCQFFTKIPERAIISVRNSI